MLEKQNILSDGQYGQKQRKLLLWTSLAPCPTVFSLLKVHISKVCYLQAQSLSNASSIQDLAAHAEVPATDSDALAAQVRQRISCALAHAHVVGGDPGSQAF